MHLVRKEHSSRMKHEYIIVLSISHSYNVAQGRMSRYVMIECAPVTDIRGIIKQSRYPGWR